MRKPLYDVDPNAHLFRSVNWTKGELMSLDVVWGRVDNPLAVNALIDTLKSAGIEGTLFLGYPVLPQVESSTTVEALLVSESPGLVAFIFPSSVENVEERKQEQDSIAYAIEGNLSKHESLRKGRRLAVTVNTVSFFPTNVDVNSLIDGQHLFATPTNLASCLTQCEHVLPDFTKPVRAAIERVTNLKPIKKRENVQRADSRGAILKKIERQIANLDEWQRRAAIETPEGPQRVRGLAGSGKTIVLALKASFLHTQHPDWVIAITFNTQSLSQQFTDLVDRFVLEHSGERPDWRKVQILHAWGSYGTPGLYSTVATALGAFPVDFGTAKLRYGRKEAFAGICGELLPLADKTPPNLFDAVLIDEAQDLPAEFLQLVHASTREPKRIVWAYDELQNLNNAAMVSVDELFAGKVSVSNVPNAPQQDIILPICYRNSPWALTLAHALGFGIRRKAGLVQLFDELDLWEDIGYQVDNGTLEFDSDVTLRRSPESYPAFFNELLNPADAVVVKRFDSALAQYEWIADEVKKNIEVDEIDPDDVLIILPDAYRSQSQYHDVATALQRRGIQCHLVGFTNDRKIFQVLGAVAVSGIYRAKGNEAPMVYIANADYCVTGLETISLRNILFTAMTRSRAWLRICGVGEEMDILNGEIEEVRSNQYRLSFHIPDRAGLEHLRLINRDRSPQEKEEIKRAEREIDRLQRMIEDGKLTPARSRKLQKLKNLLASETDLVEGEF